MSLVAYDNSDSSDYEDDQESSSVVVTKSIEGNCLSHYNFVYIVIQNNYLGLLLDPGTKPSTSQSISEKELENESDSSLFIALPQPTKKVPSVIEEEDEFLHKKETTNNTVKPKSKITVPSLSDVRILTSKIVLHINKLFIYLQINL